MLLGEHAVLHGRRALVCAIDQRMTVRLSRIAEKTLRIFSDLGTYESPLDVLEDHPDFRFVLDAVRQYPLDPSFAQGFGGLGQGIELNITSEFSSDIGFGSSAAVTVATHAVLMQCPRSWSPAAENYRAGSKTPPLNKFELFRRALETVHRVQGRGSGSDLAASVFGGVVAYRSDPFEVHPLCEEFPLTAVYSGSKMKTADVIRLVEERRALNSGYFEKIFNRMDASVGVVLGDDEEQCRRSFLERLGSEMILNQALMEEMGLCNAALAEIVSCFKSLNVPAKISGSGLGDCAVGLATVPALGTFATYPLTVTTHGVLVS